MKASIIIPAYNEEKTILNQLKLVSKVDYHIPYEVIVVNDGSTDSTYTEALKAKRFIKVLRVVGYAKNRGKGYAVRMGIKKAKGDIIAIQDADLEYSPSQLPKLIKLVLDGKSEVAYGSRFKTRNKSVYWIYGFGNKFLSLAASLLFLSWVSDIETNYKVFKKDLFNKLNIRANGFDFEPEITAKILKRGFRITELPISYNDRTKEEGKKIKVSDGIKALFTMIKYRFVD